ncbi:type I-E CRISPR-associated protein Cas7/Cse4/CasC [uncultured Arcanobacterium sp.]|uniref:type I-E CRISPR-associated protein Cas7/Cse4/CasC n=1 Tax=uncultured Arcanobacterium sp. TaxID=487520 RepID=UPI002613A542|nr:type I-E CRISPR-associated protein Cas7/Cse4/CasC [uncultured Arcanobacterium sp.]
MYRNLTLHFLTPISYSNLNRDDTGTPKRLVEGGVLRAMHSSQAIKRGIRVAYEDSSLDASVRSGNIAEDIRDAALEIQPYLDRQKALNEAKKIINTLTKKDKDKDKDKDIENEAEAERSIWMSEEEIQVAAQIVTEQITASEDFIQNGRTGSLAIAAFGRMFAAKPEKGTEAALSVSPAITTHAASIGTDYFTTIDDIRERNKFADSDARTGATYLGISQFTSGIFYRTVTIDRMQLQTSWTAFNTAKAEKNLRELITAIIYGQPRGKEHSTAPYTQPALVLAEEQRYRCAYSFETPVQADSIHGGFLEPSIRALSTQFHAARSFDPDNFGNTFALAGTYPNIKDTFGIEPVSKDALINTVTAWILGDKNE